MPIEFRCSGCSKLLRVGDGTSGKQAKCPQCGTVLIIPAPAATPAAPPPMPSAWEAPPRSPFAEDNPYRSPEAAMPPEMAVPGSFQPTVIDLSDAMSRAWTIVKSQFGMCFCAVLVVMVINLVVSYGADRIVIGIGQALQSREALAVMQFVKTLAVFAFNLWLGLGSALFFLNVARGREPNINDLFAGGPYLMTSIGATILYFVMVFLGILLFVVPGIIIAIMFSPFQYLIIDRRLGVIDSLSVAKDLTQGNKLTIFLMFLVMFLLAILAVLPCALGLIVYLPFSAMLWAVAYLMMSGQPTADQYMQR